MNQQKVIEFRHQLDTDNEFQETVFTALSRHYTLSRLLNIFAELQNSRTTDSLLRGAGAFTAYHLNRNDAPLYWVDFEQRYNNPSVATIATFGNIALVQNTYERLIVDAAIALFRHDRTMGHCTLWYVKDTQGLVVFHSKFYEVLVWPHARPESKLLEIVEK